MLDFISFAIFTFIVIVEYKPRNDNTACNGVPYGCKDTTLEDAKEACNKDEKCKVIENKPCLSKSFCLCDVTVVKDETGSCTHEKGPYIKE